ncbi:hypothetical protein KC19_1G142000 [Ceratodon purpureus]|uniref:Metallo-beta-lactamase domain-containing protein n=1 Tax=Ceratodon purpureus TaxID=3225 RepID=A0A8T0J529_CERPU|nr:hypothetical protein KC19_1G142000 [Ceratodon purpureus]
MAIACSSVCSCGISSRLANSEWSTGSSLPLGLRATTSSISRLSKCSVKSIRVDRISPHASVSASGSNEVATNSRAEKESSEVQEAGPSFRFMAEGNMWLLEFDASGLRVLADPWLVDNQTFWDQAWLYSGRSESRQKGGFPGDLTMDYVNSVDALLISQEWEDHCHLPTLKLLRKDIPVFASPKAAPIVQQLGFTDVRSVAHGTSSQIPGLQVWATVGGRVGPPWALRENGFVLQELQSGLRIYYEPHCSFDEESVRSVSPVDVVITPGRQYKVAGFPLTESVEEAVRLLRILKPQLVVPIQLTHLEITGVTAPIVQLIGSVNDFEADLRKAGINARVVVPPLSGHFMHVELGSRKQAQ